MASRLLAGLLLLAAAGCSSYQGVAEFNAYRDASIATEQTSDAILDRLAVAERDLFKLCVNHLRRTADEECAEFDPETDAFYAEDAAFIASVGDPPATAAFRRMMNAVRAYSDALNGLANGASAESMASKMSELAGLGTSAANAIAGNAAPAAGAVTAAAASVNSALAAFKPLTTAFLGFQTRSVFRKELQARAPDIRNALERARKGSELIFQALQDQIVLGTDDELTERDRNQIQSTRLLLANWVVMLNMSIGALNVAVAATDEDGEGSFTGLLHASQDLSAAALAARRNLAGATN